MVILYHIYPTKRILQQISQSINNNIIHYLLFYKYLIYYLGVAGEYYVIISSHNTISAGVAQSVAHLIGSEEVTGSIPVASSKKALTGFFHFTLA